MIQFHLNSIYIWKMFTWLWLNGRTRAQKNLKIICNNSIRCSCWILMFQFFLLTIENLKFEKKKIINTKSWKNMNHSRVNNNVTIFLWLNESSICKSLVSGSQRFFTYTFYMYVTCSLPFLFITHTQHIYFFSSYV